MCKLASWKCAMNAAPTWLSSFLMKPPILPIFFQSFFYEWIYPPLGLRLLGPNLGQIRNPICWISQFLTEGGFCQSFLILGTVAIVYQGVKKLIPLEVEVHHCLSFYHFHLRISICLPINFFSYRLQATSQQREASRFLHLLLDENHPKKPQQITTPEKSIAAILSIVAF